MIAPIAQSTPPLTSYIAGTAILYRILLNECGKSGKIENHHLNLRVVIVPVPADPPMDAEISG